MDWKENPVRVTTVEVMKQAEHVSINREALLSLANAFKNLNVKVPAWDNSIHLETTDERSLLNYLIALDCVNLCFWSREERWTFECDGKKYNGYAAMALAMRYYFLSNADDAKESMECRLAKMTPLKFRGLAGNRGKGLLLVAERANILQRVFGVICDYYGGDSRKFISEANGSLPELVRMIMADFYSFYDTARYNDYPVYFLKRAQILAIDIYGAFGGQGIGKLSGTEYSTAFADYKVPQVLRHYGVLEYSDELSCRINDGKILKPGSPEEVEIRSATIQAVEGLRDELQKFGLDYKAYQVDWILWNESRKIKIDTPYHLTKTVFY